MLELDAETVAWLLLLLSKSICTMGFIDCFLLVSLTADDEVVLDVGDEVDDSDELALSIIMILLLLLDEEDTDDSIAAAVTVVVVANGRDDEPDDEAPDDVLPAVELTKSNCERSCLDGCGGC